MAQLPNGRIDMDNRQQVTECPRCLKTHLEQEAHKQAAANAVAETPVQESPYTLHEEVDIGVSWNDRFDVYYSCDCAVCGFAFSFQHSELVPIDKAPPRTS